MVFTVEKCFKSYSWVDSFLILVLKKIKNNKYEWVKEW